MPESVSAGNAYVNIVPKVDGNTEAVGKEVGSKLSGGMKGTFGAGAVALGNMLADALTSVASTLGAQVSKTFWNYADYEQLVGGVDTLFKDASSTVQENAKRAFETAGMSANDYMENVTSFSASLINSLDGDTAKAAAVADKAIADMSDNANKMGTDMESITMAYQGFAKGQYQLLDNLKLGYGGTRAEAEKMLKDASEIAGVEFNIDSYADVIEAIHVIQENMDITGTTMREGASTISGSLNMLNGAWENFLTAIGDGGRTMDLTQVTDDLIKSIGAVASNVVPALARIGSTIALELPGIIADAFASMSGSIASAINGFFAQFGLAAGVSASELIAPFATVGEQLSLIFEDLSSIVSQAIYAIMPVVLPVLQMLGSVVGSAMNTVVLAVSQLTGFLAQDVMPTLTSTFSGIAPILSDAAGFISSFATEALGFLGDAFENVLTVAQDVWPGVSQVISEVASVVLPIVRTAFGGVKTAITSAFNAVRSIANAVWPVVSNVIKTAVNAAKNVVSTATGAIKTAFNGLKAISSTVRNIFNAVKDAITKPIETARGLIKSAVDKIKSVFSGLHLDIPKPKIPHISVSGGSAPFGIGGKGSLPHFSVDWYAAGGIVNNATLIGTGEKGTEFIWPEYDPYMSKYAKAIADNMPKTGGGVTVNFTYNGREDATGAVRMLTSNLRQLKATGAI